jgi:predicted  nucleic acid-binding Zn-ribbon protein
MSSVAEQLLTLAELARLDQRARSVTDKLESLPVAAKKADAAATKLKSDLDAAQARRSTALAAKKTAETEITDEKHKIRKWEARSNELRGEREHAALGSEIGGAKRHIRSLEDAVLEQMESIESADKDIASLSKKHEAAVADAAAEWAKVSGELAALREESAGFAVSRAALLAKLPAPVMKRYDTVAAKRGGVGVAVIDAKDICSACHRAVPPQLVIQIMKGAVLDSCPSCQRLLVHHAMTRAPEAPAT